MAASSGAETVTDAVDAFARTVATWPAEDPRRVWLAAVRVLAQRLDEGVADVRVADYIVTSMHDLADFAADKPDVLDEINAEGAARMVAMLARQRGA